MLAILASLYVHIMIRRLVPSLATELHLTVRLLHVHSGIACGSRPRSMKSEHHRAQLSTSRRIALSPAVTEADVQQKGNDQGDSCMHDQPEEKNIFKTGLDCRWFAASVLLGLKSLLPHIGTETLELLSGSLAHACDVKVSAVHLRFSRVSMVSPICTPKQRFSINPSLSGTFPSGNDSL